MSLYLPGGAPSLDAPRHYPGSAPIPTRSTDILAPSWEGHTTVTGTPSPDNPATITGVPFAATATGPDGQTRSVDLGFMGYSLLDGTADSYDGVRGEFVQRVEKLVLDTIDVAYLYPAQRPAGSRTMMFSTKVISKQEELSLVCSHLPTRGVWNDDEEGAMAIGLGTYKRIAFSMLTSRLTAYGLVESDSTTHIPAIKAWFADQTAAGTPVIVYYALAEPVAYNQKADLRAFDGQTTVTGVDTVDVIEGRVLRVADLIPFEIANTNQNMIINPTFGINQRNQNVYQGQTYTVDMWGRRGTKTEIKTSVISNGVKISGPNITDESYQDFSQRIENYQDLLGKQVTVSALFNNLDNVDSIDFGLYTSNGIFANTTPVCRKTGVRGDGLYSVTAVIPMTIAHSGINFCFRVWFKTGGGSYEIHAAKLEFSPTQTLARKVGGQWVLNDPPPDPTLELLKCQRYQLSLLDPLITGQSYIFKGKASEPSRFYGVLPTPVPMRTIPRVITDCSESAPYLAFGITSTGYSQNIQITEIGAYSKMQHGVVLFARASDIVRGNDYQVYIKNTNTHQFLLDANL